MRKQIQTERHHRGDGASFYRENYEHLQAQKKDAFYDWQEVKGLLSALRKHKGGIHDHTVLAVGRKVVKTKSVSMDTNRQAREIEKKYTHEMNIDWLVSVFADKIGDAFYDDDHKLLSDDEIIDAIYDYCVRWIEETTDAYPPSDDLTSYIESSYFYAVYTHLRGLPRATKSIGAKGYMTQEGVSKVPSSYLMSEVIKPRLVTAVDS